MPALANVKRALASTNAYVNLQERITETASPTEILTLVEEIVLAGMKVVQASKLEGAAKKQAVMDALLEVLDPIIEALEKSTSSAFVSLLPSFVSNWIDTVVAVRKGTIDYKKGIRSLLCCA